MNLLHNMKISNFQFAIFNYLLLFLLSISIASAQEVDESLFVASLERTTCYGNCPYYEIKLYSNGLAIYHGKKNVKYLGLHKAMVGGKIVAMIINKAAEIGYENLGSRYPEKGFGIIDFPMCITTVQTAKGKKTVYNRNDSPQKLVEYQNLFDELFEDIEWKLMQ